MNTIGVTPSQIFKVNPLDHSFVRPTLLLEKRNGDVIGKLLYEDLSFNLVGKGVSDFQITVHKVNDNHICEFWDQIKDLQIINWAGFKRFVVDIDINESTETIKHINCVSLEGDELSQAVIRNLHVNDKDAMTTLDPDNMYSPTYLYVSGNPKHSLLDRVLNAKTKHWRVGYVDDYFNVNGRVYKACNLQREFTIDGQTPYDVLEGTISQECGCTFVYDTYDRVVNCYNTDECVFDTQTMKVLNDVFYDLDTRTFYKYQNGSKVYVTGSYQYIKGIGQDTTILLTRERLSENVTVNSDKDSIKNCFYVTGGDDVITNYVASSNATGNNYIYKFAYQYELMSDGLVQKIKDYQDFYKQKEVEFNRIGGVYVYDENAYYDEGSNCYRKYDSRSESRKSDPIIIDDNVRIVNNQICVLSPYSYYENGTCYDEDGNIITKTHKYEEPGLFIKYCQATDRLSYWENNKFPNMTVENTTATAQLQIIEDYFSSNPLIITNACSENSFSHVTLLLSNMCGVLVDNRYKATAEKDGSSCTKINDSTNTGTWTGKIIVVRETDEDDYDEATVTITVKKSQDAQQDKDYCDQKIKIALAKMDVSDLPLTYNMTTEDNDDDLRNLFSQYNLTSLKSFRESFGSCINVLDDLKNQMLSTDDNRQNILSSAFDKAYSIYENRRKICVEYSGDVANETTSDKTYVGITEAKVIKWQATVDDLGKQVAEFQKQLSIESFLGDDYTEFLSFIREDEYNNGNYTSEGLSDSEILYRANELKEVATAELEKASSIHYTINGTINNIFNIKELETIKDNFNLFNYVRYIVDGRIYKLRLLQIQGDENSLDKINVTFGDVVSVVDMPGQEENDKLEAISSMSTTYDATTLQARQGSSAYTSVDRMKNEGLNSSEYIIRNSNAEIIHDDHGSIYKNMNDNSVFSNNQLRITPAGIYLTDDGWRTTGMAVGTVIMTNPTTGLKQKYFGVIADYIYGNLLAGNGLKIQDKNGTVTIDGTGIELDGGSIRWKTNLPQSSVQGLPDELSIIETTLQQVDGRIQTYSQTTDPRNNRKPQYSEDWGNDDDHIGDLWNNPVTGETKRWNGSSWEIVIDTYLESLAKSKARIFTERPTVPYFKGDMIIALENFTVDGRTYKAEKVYRALRNSTNNSDGTQCIFSNSDWDALDYTNDDAIDTFLAVDGPYDTYKQQVQNQLDGKTETWYMANNPVTENNWNTTAKKQQHVGDLWWEIGTQNTYVYEEGGDYLPSGGYGWKFMNVPKSVFDDIDGKRQVFIKKPTSTSAYMNGDLWRIDRSDCTYNSTTQKYTITVNGTVYEENTTLIAILPTGTTSRSGFVASDWTDISTHDGIVALDQSTQALGLLDDIASDGKITASEKQDLKRLWDNLVSDKEAILKKCTQCGISATTSDYTTDYSNFTNKFTTLSNTVVPLLSSLTTTSDVPSNFTTNFSNYYSAKEIIEEDIIKKTNADIAYALERAEKGISDAAMGISLANDAKDYADTKDTALSCALTTAYEGYADTKVGSLDSKVADYFGLGGGTIFGDNYIISPLIEGGYLNITNGSGTTRKQVIIDPNNLTNTGYIFAVRKGNEFTVGIDSSGNAAFKGAVTATSLTISPNASVSGMKIISSVSYDYANSDTTTQPADSQFSSTINPTKGKYLWTRTTTSYQGGNYPDDKSYSCNYIGIDGTTTVQFDLIVSVAAVSKSISGVYSPDSITLTAKATNGTSAPIDYNGRFKIETTNYGTIWTTVYRSSSNESSTTYTIPSGIKIIRCSLYAEGGTTTLLDEQTIPIVEDGANGKDAYTVILSNESHTFAGTESSAIIASTTTSVIGYKGATQVTTTVGTITGIPNGMSATVVYNGTANTYISISVTTSMTTRNGTLIIPVTIDGKIINKVFSYALALKGTDGTNGTNGINGTDGISISKMRLMYGVSNSSTTQPTQFNSSRPSNITSSQFVWTRCDYMYSNSSSWITGTPQYDSIVTAECKSALVVETDATGLTIHPLNNSTDYMKLVDDSLDFAINSKVKAHFGTDGIWLGGSTSDSASSSNYAFKVDSSGNGYFSGSLLAATGTFSGSLSAATGTFSGTISAAAGQFTQSFEVKVPLMTGWEERIKSYTNGFEIGTFVTNDDPSAANYQNFIKLLTNETWISSSKTTIDARTDIYLRPNMGGKGGQVNVYGDMLCTGKFSISDNFYINDLSTNGSPVGMYTNGVFNVGGTGRTGFTFCAMGDSFVCGNLYVRNESLGSNTIVNISSTSEARLNLSYSNRIGRIVMTPTNGGRFGLYIEGTDGGWLVRNDKNSNPDTVFFDKNINCQQCISARVTSTPNCYIDGAGTFHKTSGSAKRFKEDFSVDLSQELDPSHLYDIQVYSYKYKKEYMSNEEDIRYHKDVIGILADDVLEKYPIAAEYHYDKEGNKVVDDWSDRYIVPAMLKLIQDQKKEIENLKDLVKNLIK